MVSKEELKIRKKELKAQQKMVKALAKAKVKEAKVVGSPTVIVEASGPSLDGERWIDKYYKHLRLLIALLGLIVAIIFGILEVS